MKLRRRVSGMNDQKQTVHLHVGGQTTGAEDFVVYLAANRAGLRRAGYGLFCFDVMAAGGDVLADSLPQPGSEPDEIDAAAAALARRFAPDRKSAEEGFVISAPDLAGPIGELMLGRFHPHARLRARVLRRALGQGVDRLVLAVQPYETLFHSTWMALALNRKMEPFANYAEALAQFQGGWADLAQVLVEELEVRELVIQAAPVNAAQMLTSLVPGLNLRQPIQPLPKPRATPGAVAMVQRLVGQNIRLQAGQRDRLVAFHARQPQVRPDFGMSALALSDLRGRYIADLHMLSETVGAGVFGAPIPALAAE